MKNFMGVMVSHGTLQGLQDEERDCHGTLQGYKINFMGVVVSHGTLPGYRMKNVTVMVHCRVTG